MGKMKRVVGIVIIGLVVVGLVVAGVVWFRTVQPGKLIFTVQFEEANDLKAGDAVYVKGFKIGEVRSVDLDFVRRAVVAKVMLDAMYALPNDSFFFIWSDKLVDDSKCILVQLGESATSIKRDDVVVGESSRIKIMTRIDPKWSQSVWDAVKEMNEKAKTSGIDDKVKSFGDTVKNFWKALTR